MLSPLRTTYRRDADVEVGQTRTKAKFYAGESQIGTLINVHRVHIGISTSLLAWNACLAVVPSTDGGTAVDDLHDDGISNSAD